MEERTKTKPLGMRIFESIFRHAMRTWRNYDVRSFYLVFAILCLVLAAGDSFHLIPRIIENIKGSLKNRQFAFGLGNLIS